MDLVLIFEKAREIVRKAGQQIKGVRPEEGIEEKEGAFNFVTRYDTMVQGFLIKELGKFLPQAGFVGEEGDWKERNLREGYVFIIDPIDGTTNFICGFPSSAVSVALAFQGKIQFGMVYNPFREEMFSAFLGKGAYLNGVRLRLADRPLSEGVACIDISPYNPELRESAFSLAKALSHRCMDLRDIGSAALSICYVAAGRCVAYYSLKLCVWDYAAASLVLEEAGGRIWKGDGTELDLETGVSVVAGTERAAREIAKL